LFCSCSGGKKHLEKAQQLENQGLRIDANNEYLRALKATSDKKKRGEIQNRIAENYLAAAQYPQAIEYFKQSIESFNSVPLKAPYQRLSDAYIISGDPKSASVLLTDLDREKPVDAMQMKAEIGKALGAYYESKANLSEAVYYYEQYLKAAQEIKNPGLTTDAQLRLNNAKDRK
jgi:tetratricopeptide (TPR) repeat protein